MTAVIVLFPGEQFPANRPEQAECASAKKYQAGGFGHSGHNKSAESAYVVDGASSYNEVFSPDGTQATPAGRAEICENINGSC